MVSRLNLNTLRHDGQSENDKSRKPDVQERVAKPVVEEEETVARPTIVPGVTEDMITDAVEDVLGKSSLNTQEKAMIRQALARDVDAGFASQYYQSRVKQDAYVASTKVRRKRITLNHAVSAEEIADLVQYAPDYDLHFAGEESHCHGVGAGMRKIDTNVLLDNSPSCPFKDIGGDPLLYILRGTMNAHVCDPIEDPKDPTRSVVRRMVARKIVSERSFSASSRILAQRYLDRDPTFVCGKKAQDCTFKAKFTISVHVYDIPMQDWPEIMHRSGSVIHSGTVHFSSKFYSSTQGVLSASRAEYVIDAENDTFQMGFRGSPSWWYSHSWLMYMRYGVDQIIEHHSGRYSYKITQRRGDTVFFEIAKVAGNSTIEKQCFRLPGVRMVKVNGFKMGDSDTWDYAQGKKSRLEACVHWFPASLWHDMLVHAENEFERKVMTFDKLYNYYRTVSARNTVNGVLLSGGNKVEMEHVLPLVVHVGVVAAGRVMLGQRENRKFSEDEMRRRVRDRRSVFKHAFDTAGEMFKALGRSLSGGFDWLNSAIFGMTDKMLTDTLVQWSMEAEIQEVPFSSLVGQASDAHKARWQMYQFEEVEEAYRVSARAMATADLFRAVDAVPEFGLIVDRLFSKKRGKSSVKSAQSEGTTQSATAVNTASETVVEFVATPVMQLERQNAIRETIEESILEEKKIIEHCDMVHATCTNSVGVPIEYQLRSRAEEFGLPDFWYVNSGVLAETSFLGVSSRNFPYSAVYANRKDKETGSYFRTIREQLITVEGVEKEYNVIADTGFHGWVLTVDRLTIFNGPELRDALEEALTLPHDYKVTLRQGPPGCGKTYSLIRMMTYDDVALCPVKQSAADTRERLKELYPNFPDLRNRSSTTDAYLVNRKSKAKRNLVAVKLLADEGFMMQGGKWYASAALLKAKEIVVFGDINQIPHVPRVSAPSMYLRIKPQETHEEFITRRCPWDAVAAWGAIYDWKVRSASSVKRSMSVALKYDDLVIPDGLVVLTMYQDGKKQAREQLRNYAKSKNIQFMTVHESQGKTFRDVWLLRYDLRVRKDNMSLYDKAAYCLVACSRHTHSFVYVRARSLGDMVDKFIDSAKDHTRVERAGDVSTAGVSMLN